MKRITIVLLTVFFILPFFICNSSAETKAEKYLGAKEMCLETVRIKDTRILDDQTILFGMRDNTFYINRLVVPSPGLRIAGGFSYETSIAKLCKQDIIKVVSPSSAPSNTALLGEFIKFNETGTIDKVEKLLSDGLLKELVAEGAFKESQTKK
jgi:hypothetical protein